MIYRVELIRGQLIFLSVFLPADSEAEAVAMALRVCEVLPDEFLVKVSEAHGFSELDFMRP